MSVHKRVPGTSEAREGLGCTGTGFKDAYKPPYGCWEPNPGPLEEQPELLTTASVKYCLDCHSNHV